MSLDHAVDSADHPITGPEDLRESFSVDSPHETGLRPGSTENKEASPRPPLDHQHDSYHEKERRGVTAFQAEQQSRDVIRLFQCRRCSKPLKEAVTLPCGRNICKSCLPELYPRLNVTYPALPERLQGFQCPFEDCGKEHTPADCGPDVILNKAVHYMREQMERGKVEALQLQITTTIAPVDPWQVAGVSALRGDSQQGRSVNGGRLVATWSLAEDGDLQFNADVTYDQAPTTDDTGDLAVTLESDVLQHVKESTRNEMDCQVCYALYCYPLTTGCGHTFCRPCLSRILDHSRLCPICRRTLSIGSHVSESSSPANDAITRITEMFWIDELTTRRETVAAEQTGQHDVYDMAIFVCTLSFPLMPTFLHIFEPRYRLMIRRAWEGSRTFGMVLPRDNPGPGESSFYEYGTLLLIDNIHYYPDGRSLVETKGVSRFKVLQHGVLDGYVVGNIEKVDDVSLEEEEAAESAQTESRPSVGVDSPINRQANRSGSSLGSDRGSHRASSSGSNGSPQGGNESSPTRDNEAQPSLETLEFMSTQAMMHLASTFVAQMRAQSVPWLARRILSIYGEPPEDPKLFPWWFASILPVREEEKYRLLETSSVRERLKICCAWIIQWDTRSWSRHGCVIL